VLDDHLHEHVLHAANEKARIEAVEEISEVLRTYIR
jgi:DNA-binding FrmR family transcriptional regulator